MSILVFIVSTLLFAFSAFRLRQARGSSDINRIMSDVGGGSFTRSITSKLRMLLWGSIMAASGTTAVIAFFWFSAGGKVQEKSHSGESIAQSAPAKDRSEGSKSGAIEPPRAKENAHTEKAVDDTHRTPTLSTEKAAMPKELTREEVMNMEQGAKYSGDDPIIRARLGLPETPSSKMSD